MMKTEGISLDWAYDQIARQLLNDGYAANQVSQMMLTSDIAIFDDVIVHTGDGFTDNYKVVYLPTLQHIAALNNPEL